MIRNVFICILMWSFCHSFSQNQDNFSSKIYFSEQIATKINHYKYRVKKAKASNDFKEVARLYNDFITQELIGSYLDDFNVDCFNRKKNNLGDFKKPLVLLTYADWSGPIEDEVKIYNSYVEKLHEKIDFLCLIWDSKKKVRRMRKLFHRKTQILYVNELRNRDEHTIRMLKHALGVPTLILTNADKKIVDIIKPTPTFPDLFQYNFQERFTQAVDKIKTN